MTSQAGEGLGKARRPWLGRYRRPLPIRSRGAFQLASALRETDGQACVVLVPGPEAGGSEVSRAFASVERAHRTVQCEWIPGVAARGVFDGTPYLELACDAVMDGVDLRFRMVESQRRVPLGAADAFASKIRQALRAAHAAIEPGTRRPFCLGRLSYGNLLFSASGSLHLVGFGHNFPVQKASGVPDGWAVTFQAPEVALGAAPSPMGDRLALLLLLRSLLPLADLGSALARVVFGEPQPDDAELLHCLRWPDLHLLAQPPARRASIAEADAVTERLRALCGVRPDRDGFRSLVRQTIAGAPPPPHGGATSPGQPTLLLGLETSWSVGEDGIRHVLGQAHRRIVTALAELHRRSPEAVLTMQEVLEAGWPGERPIPEAGANRVYVALAQLRRMGMRDLIERTEGGYRFAPGARIQFSQ